MGQGSVGCKLEEWHYTQDSSLEQELVQGKQLEEEQPSQAV